MEIVIKTYPSSGLIIGCDGDKHAIAVCHPNDRWDPEIGIKLVIERLFDGIYCDTQVINIDNDFFDEKLARIVVEHFALRGMVPGGFLDKIDPSPKTGLTRYRVEYIWDDTVILSNILTGKIAVTKIENLARA